MPKQPAQPLSDADLINGKTSQPPDLPKLQGAADCKIEYSPIDGRTNYWCYFLPRGGSAAEMQDDFVRLVRLVEKAAGQSAVQIAPPIVGRGGEIRQVAVGLIGVMEVWSRTPNIIEHGLTVTIGSDRPPDYQPPNAHPTASIPGTDEIDQIIKSGRYTQMPMSQRVGSSGSGLASIKVTNDTAYTLSLVYAGTSSQTLTIPARNTATIQLPAGSWRVLGHVAAQGVLPFIGNETLGPGDSLVSTFFIK